MLIEEFCIFYVVRDSNVAFRKYCLVGIHFEVVHSVFQKCVNSFLMLSVLAQFNGNRREIIELVLIQIYSAEFQFM